MSAAIISDPLTGTQREARECDGIFACELSKVHIEFFKAAYLKNAIQLLRTIATESPQVTKLYLWEKDWIAIQESLARNNLVDGSVDAELFMLGKPIVLASEEYT